MTKAQEEVVQRLVRLPEAEWESLKEKGYHVPRSRFSAMYFLKNGGLNLKFLEEMPSEQRKRLFIAVAKSLFDFDTVVCKGLADLTYTSAQKDVVEDIGLMMRDDERPQVHKSPITEKIGG